MPKILFYKGITVFFYANEHQPIHVHAEYQGNEYLFIKLITGYEP